MLCRALSTSAAIVWGPLTVLRLFQVAKHADSRRVLAGHTVSGRRAWTHDEVEQFRLLVLQIGLSYLWVSQ